MMKSHIVILFLLLPIFYLTKTTLVSSVVLLALVHLALVYGSHAVLRWPLLVVLTTLSGVELVVYLLVRLKLHSKRVKLRTTLETSEDENYSRNE